MNVFRRKDGLWCGKFRDVSTGKWRYVYSKDRREAQQALAQAIAGMENGYTPPQKQTVAAVLDEWLENMRESVSRRTYLNRESLVRVHPRPGLGAVRVDQLRDTDIRRLLRSKLDAGLSPGTVKRLHVILKATLPVHVMASVKPPRVEQREMHVLSKQQVMQLLDTVRGDRFEAVYALGALCGLRIGEVLALRWEDLSDRGTLQVRRTLWRGNVYQCKTISSRRTLTVPQRALESILRLRSTCDGSGYPFPTSSGNPVEPPNFYVAFWKPTVRKAGMPETLTYHRLRHGAASLLLNEGVPIPVVSRCLGHANPGITMKVYAHMKDGTSHVAAAAMDSTLG
jgi:integrase